MSVKIEVVGDTAKDVIRDLLTLGDFYVKPSERAGVPAAETDTAALKEEKPAEAVAPTKRRGRQPKEQPVVEVSVETADETVEVPDAEPQAEALVETVETTPEPSADELVGAKPATLEDTRAALLSLSKKRGEDAVWTLLAKFGAKSAKFVPEDKRVELIAEAKKLEAEPVAETEGE